MCFRFDLTFKLGFKSTYFIKYFCFLRSSLLHNFSISSFSDQNFLWILTFLVFFDLLEPDFSKQKCHLIKSRISLLCCSLCWGTQLCRVFIYIKMSEIYCPATAEPQVGIQTNTNGQVFSSGGNTWHIFFTNCKLGSEKNTLY